MSITKTVKATVSISYEEHLHLDQPYDERPALWDSKVEKKFEIFYESTYLQDSAQPEKVDGRLEYLNKAIQEGFQLFTKLGKKCYSVRFDVSTIRADHDANYNTVGKTVYRSFWAVKNYYNSKSVTVRRADSNHQFSVNPDGTDSNREFTVGRELNLILNQERKLFLEDNRKLLEQVLVDPWKTENEEIKEVGRLY